MRGMAQIRLSHWLTRFFGKSWPMLISLLPDIRYHQWVIISKAPRPAGIDVQANADPLATCTSHQLALIGPSAGRFWRAGAGSCPAYLPSGFLRHFAQVLSNRRAEHPTPLEQSELRLRFRFACLELTQARPKPVRDWGAVSTASSKYPGLGPGHRLPRTCAPVADSRLPGSL